MSELNSNRDRYWMNITLIKKLSLKLTNRAIGRSSENQIGLYLWPNGVPECRTYVMACDLKGDYLMGEFLFLVRRKATNSCIIFCVPESFIYDDELFLFYMEMIQSSYHKLPENDRTAFDHNNEDFKDF